MMITKKIPIDVTFDVYSKSTIKNIIAARNLEISFETRFSFLPPGGSFLLRRKGDMNKLTSEMNSTHIKGLGIG